MLILKFRKDKTITHGPNVIFFSQINVYYVQTNYNEVVVLQQGGDWKSDRYKKTTRMRDREMSEKMKRLKMKMEVQEITFNYFARPQPRDLNFYVMMMMMMAIQKYCCPWFQNLLWVYGWPGCSVAGWTISRPKAPKNPPKNAPKF